MSMAGVLCILVSATAFSVLYIGSWAAAYGTAYGVMVGAKAAMFGALLLLGLGNFLVVERLRRRPGHPRAAPAPVRRGRDRHRHQHLLRRRLADQRAAGGRPRRRTGSPGPRSSSATRRNGRSSRRPTTTRWRCRRCRRSSTARPRRSSTRRRRAFVPGLGRAAGAQRRRHRLVRVQPPLGRAVRRADRRARAAAPGRRALGAALAARLAGHGGVPVPALRPGSLAAGQHRLLREPARRGGAAAPGVRAADRRLRAVRMGGAHRPAAQPAGGARVPAADRGGRRAAADAQPRHRQRARTSC